MVNDEKGRMSKRKNLLTRILIPSLKYGFIIPVLFLVSTVSASLIQVDDYIVTQGDEFTINIVCTPDEPIKAWEFKVSFDQTILQFLDITEGDFFHGYLTFPVMRLNATYSLIVGKGNVTGQGVLASFLFRALQPGRSPVQVCGAGVCNETRYLPLTVINGSVTVTELRVEETIKNGWNRFPDGSLTIQGYNTFGSGVTQNERAFRSVQTNNSSSCTRTQGWSTFRCEHTGQDGFWEMLSAISAATLVIVYAVIRRVKK